MFTGLVQAVGQAAALDFSSTGARLTVQAPSIAADAKLGDSIAVNGCCLTVVERNAGALAFDLLRETLDRTNLGELRSGNLVNLEPALAADGRLGGHFVQGHIDCTSEVVTFGQAGGDFRLEITLPPAFARYGVLKGSIAVDGISLTIAELSEQSFTVCIIPHTLATTNLGECKAGRRANLEFDLLAKYVERLLAAK